MADTPHIHRQTKQRMGADTRTPQAPSLTLALTRRFEKLNISSQRDTGLLSPGVAWPSASGQSTVRCGAAWHYPVESEVFSEVMRDGCVLDLASLLRLGFCCSSLLLEWKSMHLPLYCGREWGFGGHGVASQRATGGWGGGMERRARHGTQRRGVCTPLAPGRAACAADRFRGVPPPPCPPPPPRLHCPQSSGHSGGAG